jgi:hypothetical protein
MEINSEAIRMACDLLMKEYEKIGGRDTLETLEANETLLTALSEMFGDEILAKIW